MEATLRVLNGLMERGLIGPYAIGGAMALVRYMEPILTYDLDVFVTLPAAGSGGLVDPRPLDRYLVDECGYPVDRECIMIEGVPVRFLPAYNRLVEEALSEAVEMTFGMTPTRVVRFEHLIAIMIQTDRPKDRERLALALEQSRPDLARLRDILARHGLLERWRELAKDVVS